LLQLRLLKAISEGETDPEKLALMAGARSAAQVVVALDKLALRKDFHQAMSAAGLSMEHITQKLKKLVDSQSERISLGAVKTVLTSLGLSEYREGDGGQAKGWEEMVIEKMREKPLTATQNDDGIYEVAEPDIPMDILEKRENEAREAKDIYGR
jgi:hypothetical protein